VEEIPLAALLRRDCPRLTDPKHKGATFSPTPYIASGHMQTIFAALFADLVTPQLTYVRELIYLPDGGNVALDWYPHIPTSDADLALPIIVILHGLTGGSHESYVQDVVRDVSKAGYFSVVANFRGCAKTELTSMQLYCGAYTGDLRHAIGYIRRKSPVVPLFGVGFSLGANVLTKFVGETGDNCPFIGAVSIGNPFDLLLSSHLMHRSWIGRNIYSKRMTQNLIRVFKQHMHAFVNAPFDVSQVLNAKFIYEFDDFLTRKAFKYRTVHEYYRRGSSAQYVPDIRIPMLLFSALDDPIAPKEAIPTFEVKENPFVVLATTQHGGHLGWFSGVTPKRWFAGPVGEFIRSIVEAYQS
ncbi:Alpha/Beta hydrolase protein, partial [Gaertneriomyces semiglobifer]